MVAWQERLAALGCEDAERIAGFRRRDGMIDVALRKLWCARRTTVLRHRRFELSHRSMSSNLSRCDALHAVAEDVGRNEVDPAHDEDDDTRSDNDAPEGKAERFLVGSFFVEIAEHVDTQDEHGEGEGDEAMGWRE